MKNWDDTQLGAGASKWSDWSMERSKRKPKPTDYGSAIVFTLSAVMMVGVVF